PAAEIESTGRVRLPPVLARTAPKVRLRPLLYPRPIFRLGWVAALELEAAHDGADLRSVRRVLYLDARHRLAGAGQVRGLGDLRPIVHVVLHGDMIFHDVLRIAEEVGRRRIIERVRVLTLRAQNLFLPARVLLGGIHLLKTKRGMNARLSNRAINSR